MATVEIHPQKISGRWKSGVALDFHTTSSTPIGPDEFGQMQFRTLRPPIAQLLYELKYRQNQDAVHPIVETAVAFLTPHRQKFDLLVPVPPSQKRRTQPVWVLAHAMGRALPLPVSLCVRTTRATNPLKGMTDPQARRQQMDGLYVVDAAQTQGKRILLFDDLFRSGSTMNAITEALLGPGQATIVYALTITKTRSNQ